MPPLIDIFDAKLLSHWQRDGRLTSVQMSELIHLSQSATARRMAQLREAGVVTRIVAVLDPMAVGWPVRVNLLCSLERTAPDAHDQFVAALRDDPAVADADVVMGGADFALSVRARSMEDYGAWLERYHERFPNLKEVRSYAVLDEVKRGAPIPVEATGPDHA